MGKRICTICKIEKPFSEFHKHARMKDGIYNQCKECRRIICHKDYENRKEQILEYVKQYRKTDRGEQARLKERENLIKNYPLKYKANYTLKNAIRDKRIKKRNICEICYASPTECHHEDYTKPFDFIELCKKCHTLLHNQYRAKIHAKFK